MDDMKSLWAKINAAAIPGFTGPLTLVGGYAIATFLTDLAALKTAYTTAQVRRAGDIARTKAPQRHSRSGVHRPARLSRGGGWPVQHHRPAGQHAPPIVSRTRLAPRCRSRHDQLGRRHATGPHHLHRQHRPQSVVLRHPPLCQPGLLYRNRIGRGEHRPRQPAEIPDGGPSHQPRQHRQLQSLSRPEHRQ